MSAKLAVGEVSSYHEAQGATGSTGCPGYLRRPELKLILPEASFPCGFLRCMVGEKKYMSPQTCTQVLRVNHGGTSPRHDPISVGFNTTTSRLFTRLTHSLPI